MRIRTLGFALLWLSGGLGFAGLADRQQWQGWELWRNGEVAAALEASDKVLSQRPGDNEALHLRALALYIQGKYREALETFSKIDPGYPKRAELGRSLIEAYYHLRDADGAARLAKELEVKDASYFEARARKPFSVTADRTFVLPFVAHPKVPAQFWPGVTGKINGQPLTLMLDTGGSFVIMGKDKAEALGVELFTSGSGWAATREVTVTNGLASRLELGEGLVFENVPVSVMPKLDFVIFGTNILEPFLATIDYPNSRFVLTPRNHKELYPAHQNMLSPAKIQMPFFLWSDHFMFGKGVFKAQEGLNFFFDSGLVAITIIDGKPAQAAFSASKERLMAWGFPESDLAATRFFDTANPLGVPGLLQEKSLVYYDVGLPSDRVFGGVRMDGVLSHAWLSHYCWTIDFDSRQYSFGIK